MIGEFWTPIFFDYFHNIIRNGDRVSGLFRHVFPRGFQFFVDRRANSRRRRRSETSTLPSRRANWSAGFRKPRRASMSLSLTPPLTRIPALHCAMRFRQSEFPRSKFIYRMCTPGKSSGTSHWSLRFAVVKSAVSGKILIFWAWKLPFTLKILKNRQK